MKAVCPKDPMHDKFLTTAHVMEEWKVDNAGNFLEVVESLQTDHGPDPDNEWSCAICGEKATVTR